nr:hypothetical protein CTI12_AA187700 [Tanacetum cinerariifolium]
NQAWIWDEECQAAFESLKKAVIMEPVLRLPDVTMPFELHTDASDFAIGGEGLEHDPLAKKTVALEKDGKTRRFWLKGDMLFTKGDWLYVPKWGDLRRIILKECHDLKWPGHPGIKRTLALIEGTYYWPRIEDDVETFVRTCLIFQQDKIEQKKSGGLLEPLPMPKGPWESVSTDFITCLPKSVGSGSIMVVVDRFSKYGTFIAAPPDITADDTAKLFFKNVVNEATGKSPFELVMGHQPLTPNALAASYEGSSLAAYKTMKEWHEQADMAWASLDKATKRMKKWADKRRRHVEFEVGDQVMLKIHPVFHISFLKPYHGDEEDLKRGVPKRVPTAVVTLYDREVEEILSDRTIRRRGVPSYKEYLIKWRDLPDSEASWEPKDLLWQFTAEIKRYHEDGTTRTRLSGILWKVEEGLGSLWKIMEKIEGGGSIIVVLDRFSKYGTFIALPPDVTADDTAKLFLKNVGSRPGAYKTIREWYKQANLARASLDKAAKKMKKWADERRRHVDFKVGDQVMVKLLLQQFKSLKNVHKGLIRRYEGPFSMIGRVGKVSYRVQLPLKLKIHLVFYVSFLKPYHGDE